MSPFAYHCARMEKSTCSQANALRQWRFSIKGLFAEDAWLLRVTLSRHLEHQMYAEHLLLTCSRQCCSAAPTEQSQVGSHTDSSFRALLSCNRPHAWSWPAAGQLFVMPLELCKLSDITVVEHELLRKTGLKQR